MTLEQLRDWIKKHEGFESKPYIDTAGKLTIGWGRNLQDNGISSDEADYLLSNDLKHAMLDLKQYSWYLNQPDDVKFALINMCFNLGINRLLTFKKMIQALVVKDYVKAAIEALDSKWAHQVGERAKDVAMMIRGSK